MNVQKAPQAARTLYAAAALIPVAVLAIVIDQGLGEGLAGSLRAAYPLRPADEIATGESSILTYLFTLAVFGLALFLAMGRAAARGGRWTRHAGAALVVLGGVLAAYHFTQPHPLVMTVAGLIPAVVGLAALPMLWKAKA